MVIKNGRVYLPGQGFTDCDLGFGELIEAAGSLGEGGYDASGCYVVPGFVDIHTHGAMNCDFSDGDAAAMPVLADYYARSGVTSFLATTMTLKEPELTRAMHAVRDAGDTGAAHRAGVHP